MNLEYLSDKFQKGLRNLINESQLPPIVVYYVLKDMLGDVSEIVHESCLVGEKEEWDKKYPNGKKETKEIPLNIIDENGNEVSNVNPEEVKKF